MRTSRDDYKDGLTYNGYDYDLQTWVMDGIIMDCSHTKIRTERNYEFCEFNCASNQNAGRKLSEVKRAVA